MGRQLRSGYSEMLAREPLVLGAFGLAVGAAVGALLPRTRYEDSTVGPYRDQLRDEAVERVREGVEEAADVAKETYSAARNEADRQGLRPEADESLSQRVAKVAGAAAETAEKQARSKTQQNRS